jgi:hypothetical protein
MFISADRTIVTEGNIYEDLVKESYSNIGKEENYEGSFSGFSELQVNITSTRDKILKGFDISQSKRT